MKKNTKLAVWLVGAIIVAAIIIVAMITSSAKNESVASVAGNNISKEDLYNALVKDYGTATLDTLISDKIINLEAEKQNIKVTDDEIQKELDTLYAQYGGEKALKEQLKASGSSVDAIKKDIVQYVKTKKLIEPTIKITDAEINAYFEQNKASFAQTTLADNKAAIKDTLVTGKLQTEYATWLEKKKAEYKITTSLDKTKK